VTYRPTLTSARESPVSSAIEFTGEHETLTSPEPTSMSNRRGPWLE
jgi:hypothetical protein